MQVDKALVSHLAHLSRLDFNHNELSEIQADMQKIIGFVEKLNELDTTGVVPLRHMSSAVNVLRPDEVKGSITRQQAFKNAPVHDDQFFKVPKVFKNKG